MKPVVQSIKNFLVDESGPTAVEYAVMVALVIIACLASISGLATQVNGTFNAVGTRLQTAAAGAAGS